MPRREAEVELGPYKYTVVPQKLGRLRYALNRAFSTDAGEIDAEEIAEATQDGRAEDMVEQLGGQAHTVLSVFIPDLMPKHEWLGFASEEAMEADNYAEGTDRSPDMPQIVDALEKCMHVNRMDLVKHLRSLVSPDFLRAMIQKAIGDFLMSNSTNSSSPATADTPTTTSPTTPPTSEIRTSVEPVDDGYDFLDASSLTEPIGASAG